MKNQGDNNSNVISDDSDDEVITVGDNVIYTSEDGQTHEATVEAVVCLSTTYELVDDDGNVLKVDSSRVRPVQPQHQVAKSHNAEPNLKKVDRIPLYASVVLLKGPYAGKQGILVNDRTSHLTVVVPDGEEELKKVHVGGWEDMMLETPLP